ncbi:hypothetical protein K491DRAFT_695926 [Lophiostoma macrostomum CBS 122681]|uniref:BZIP domain-containing protein n=1 Tax=Lophiostoma macrostomum CBS 122681 TaxID=1314788 RepID=A0A6A6SWN5_9PLEO|nr:hypothetical protein K491DRAFT_695926 [Lophiostoma macrostomum CBS 122681]
MSIASLPSPLSHANSNATPLHTPSPTSETHRNSFSRPSSSRAINPAPVTTRVPLKVAIATASSPGFDYVDASPGGGGPNSTTYVIPPRPKPGRKPATDEPASKRKAQNRESQRAFRARKAAKLTEMQSQVESAEQRHRQELNEKIVEVSERDVRLKNLETALAQLKESEKRTAQERDYWKERALRFEEAAKQYGSRRNSLAGWEEKPPMYFHPAQPSSRQDSPTRVSMTAFTPTPITPQAYETSKPFEGCGNCKPGGPCACLEAVVQEYQFMAPVPLIQAPIRSGVSPTKGIQVSSLPTDPAAIFAEREIDFTAQFSNKRNKLDTRPSIAFLTQAAEVRDDTDPNCGFCTDDVNCVCKYNSDRLNTDDIPPLVNEKLEYTGGATKGPGTCADCMRDPKQRAWCQRVAQLKTSSSTNYPSSSPMSRNSSITSGIDPMEPRTDYAPIQGTDLQSRLAIGCSDAYKLLDGRVPTDQDSMDWSTLNPISASARTDTLPSLSSRTYSALELDTAGVIATLQQSMGPLTPRKEDGAYKNLIRLAQENQGSSGSGSPSIITPPSNQGWR